MKKIALTFTLLSGLAAAQTSVLNIPVLPLGVPTVRPVSSPPAAVPATAPSTSTGTTEIQPVPIQPSIGQPNQSVPSPVKPNLVAPNPGHSAAPATGAGGGLPAVTTLPTAANLLAGSYRVSLSGPATVRAGQANTWAFHLSNTGQTPLHLQHGACDVRFEVLNAAGQVVRPDLKNTLCTMQLVILDAPAGQTATVQNIRWEGKNGAGQAVAPGVYTIRAKYVSGEAFSPAATFRVTVQ